MYREILKPIIRSPEFPQLLKELHEYWENEQIRRKEFYDWITPDLKAEFIDGEVVIHSPVRSRHNVVLKFILRLLDIYVEKRKLGYVGVEKIMCRFPRNDYEPDLCFFDKTIATNFTDEQTIFPIPQMIVEILSASTESRDRGVKFNDYQANGVQEYWIVDANTNVLEQYTLLEGQYELKGKYNHPKQIVTSKIIAGFEVSLGALFDAELNLKEITKM